MQAGGRLRESRDRRSFEGPRRLPSGEAHFDYKTSPPELSLQIFAKGVAARGRINGMGAQTEAALAQ